MVGDVGILPSNDTKANFDGCQTFNILEYIMAHVCTACGKGPTTGNHVSHANNRRKRRWLPNLQTVRVMVGDAPRRVRVCASCIRSGKVTKARAQAAAAS